MGAGRHLPGLAIIITAMASPGAAAPPRDLASVLAMIDQGFVCPQFLPNDEARHAELVTFSRALASVGPTRVTYRQAAYIRAKMLQRHNCAGNSSTVASADAPPD